MGRPSDQSDDPPAESGGTRKRRSRVTDDASALRKDDAREQEADAASRAGRKTGRSQPGAGDAAENAIRPVKRRAQDRTTDTAAAARSDEAEQQAATGSRKKAASDRSRAIPEEIWERFIGIGSKYYFPDGTPAFVDRGTRLTTPSENTEVVRSLVSIAQARGWNSIEVSGSERFRKEAWFAAQRVGLEVLGYNASAIEQAQLIRNLAQRRASAAREEQPNRKDKAPVSGARRRRQKADKGARDDTDSAPPRPGAVFVGRLLEHGRDTYRHDPLEQSSYYVRLETKEGEREIWGVDLERAVRQSLSNARIGDEVAVRAVGREPVTVPSRERDAHGRIIGQKSLATHRNEWIVERTDFLTERERAAKVFRDAKISPQDAVKKHPELQGSYLKLQAVKLGAERDLKDAQERARLVARARVLIAESIERGEPLEPVRLRESGQRKPDPERATPHEPERSR